LLELHQGRVGIFERELLDFRPYRNLRGVGGGYTLARDPHEITVLDIYTALDEDVHLAPCVGPDLRCEREDSCAARDFWHRMSRVLLRELRSTTIGDLLENMKIPQRR